MKPSWILTTIVSLVPFSVIAAPATSLEERQGINWPKCLTTGSGYCTVYMATGDSKQDVYRTAALFDSNCKLTHAIMTTKENPKITLKGHLPNYVDLYVNDFYRPQGWVSYYGADTPLRDDTMSCYKITGSDGVGCRKAFDCSA